VITDTELLGVLVIAFLPGIVLVIAGAISAARSHGVTFLWCLRFEPVRERLRSILHEMHPVAPAVGEPEYDSQDLPGTAIPVIATCGRSRPAPMVRRH
jgi:hypothetical protein